jgi:hypothetical protein
MELYEGRALQTIPEKLEKMYKLIVDHLEHQQPPSAALRAKRALLAVMHSQRPLYLEELQYVLATCPNTHQFNGHPNVITEGAILSECCGLLTVKSDDASGGRKQVRFFRK